MIELLFRLAFFSPFVWIVLLGLAFFSKLKLSEGFLGTAVKLFSLYITAVCFSLFVATWVLSPKEVLLDFDDWFSVVDYRFPVRFIIDLLGGTYAFLSAALIGIIFRFSQNYLHKEEGYFRFVFLLSMMLFGLIIVSFSRSLDLLFAGWELVGTTSVLLISYFYNQIQPVRHSLKAIISYRLCDMGILAAAAWAHHYLHTTDFVRMSGAIAEAQTHGSTFSLLMIGGFVIWGSLAKAGQLPMCSWLPTAMDCSTPSSAIFYEALSVHLGPFLLIRCHDYFLRFPPLLWLIGRIGAASACYATLVGRTRPDAKTMLGYATISQVGIIYVEIAVGLTNFALFHMVAHASLRTWQFLRSASVIQDFYENPTVQKNVTINRRYSWERVFSGDVKRVFFIHALHGFHLDYLAERLLRALSAPARALIRVEDWVMRLDDRLLKYFFSKGDR